MGKSAIAQAATETTASQNTADNSSSSDELKTDSGLVVSNKAGKAEETADNTASPSMAASSTTDMITGTKTYGAWSTAEWPAYNEPKIKGYKTSVEGTDGTSKVERELVTYKTNNQNVTVKYLKDSAAKSQPASLKALNTEKGKRVGKGADSSAASAANTTSAPANALSSAVASSGSASLSSQSSTLPATGNGKDNAVFAAGTFASGASLLMTVIARHLERKQENKDELLQNYR